MLLSSGYAFRAAMSEGLSHLQVLALDCQAAGATPAHGDLLELGWAACSGHGIVGPVQSRWIVPRTNRPIRRAVRELTGWSEGCVAEAVEEHTAWALVNEEIARLAHGCASARVPTLIHFARFELPFLNDLQQRFAGGRELPLDVVCLHAVSARLFPDLPRRNIRALAGYLGHTPEQLRRAAGHVQATAFIWREILPLLDRASVHTWSELKVWLGETPVGPRPARRRFPLAAERRRALPSKPGVYRFLRLNGDVLYVGKAVNLRKRVASHFKSRGPITERGLELLTQVHAVSHTESASMLEAALLEADEIKRIDPAYNVQLRCGDRSTWFSSTDLTSAVSTPDKAHPLGPLPSQRALSAWSAFISLLDKAEASAPVRAAALGVPVAFAPEEQLFVVGWRGFVDEVLDNQGRTGSLRVAHASRALWLERGRVESSAANQDVELAAWDVARVRRRLERGLVQAGLLLRRARWLCLLSEATVAFRERDMERARAVLISQGAVVERFELAHVAAVAALPARRWPALPERRRCFDIATYDRLRVLLTELQRVRGEGGEIAMRIGRHTLGSARLTPLMSDV